MVNPNIHHYRYRHVERRGRLEMRGLITAVAMGLMLAVAIVYSVLR